MTTPIYRFPTQTEIASYLREKIQNPWYDDKGIIHKVSQLFASKKANEMGITIVLALGLHKLMQSIDPNMQAEEFVVIQRILKQALIDCSMPAARL
ncbi:MAG: hypothetical protein A3E80_03925 [Chlamydiae bacterium RIFCSPHIGHO2_12_FULL_49_9]|nr:MAG: hypothetical protein A3E80_03925 [Chlamydiae bacterium RIFCSPHIGHO2_12_FULL_49_9]